MTLSRFFQVIALALVVTLASRPLLSASLRVEFPGFKKLPGDWQILSEQLPDGKELNLRFALHPKGGNSLEKKLLQIATPGSPEFRKYLSKSEITNIVGHVDDDISQVTKWLSDNGVKVVSVNQHKDWIIASASVKTVEDLLQCKLSSYVSKKLSKSKITARGSYSIPEEISYIVHFVAGMTSFPGGRWQAITAPHAIVAAGNGVPAAVTPDTIYSMYGVDHSGSHGTKLGSQAVVEFGNLANFNDADLQTFFSSFQPTLLGETCGVVSGSNNGNVRASVEANLDVQYIMAAGVFVNTTDYKITGSGNIEDEFLDYTIMVNEENQPPLVHSISYGEYGGSYDNTTDQRFSYELQKMGIAGVSVLLASGDNGVGCNADGTSQEFDYPSSGYITMVGATYLDAGSNLEVGATLSSGGFSKDFMQPAWQADAVNGYLASGVTLPKEYFYAPGRAYPDLAAFGQNVQVVAGGKSQGVSGTSCSAPITAGVIASINSDLLAAGLAPLGFLNPWLYANPQMFTDVVSGSNPYEKCEGFQATVGWDPVTGLGTPIYPKMKAAAFAAVGALVPSSSK